MQAGREKIIQIDDATAGEREEHWLCHENGGIKDIVNGDLDHEGDHAFGEGDERHQHNAKREPERVRPDVAQESF